MLFLSFSVYIFLSLVRLSTIDMFLDGVTYSAISRNMALGYGSIWAPHYTDTLYSVFYWHPPLGFFLQSLVYRICGDNLIIDTLWGICIGLAVIALIHQLWKKLNQPRSSSWLPVLVFVIFPIVPWAFTNNVLENLLTFFCLASVILIITALNGNIYLSVISSLLMLLGFLTKGAPALFPFVVPAAFFILKKTDLKRTLLAYAYMLIPFALIMSYLVFIDSGSSVFFKNYLQSQLVNSLDGKMGISPDRFYVIKRIFSEMLAPGVILLVLHVVKRLRTAPVLKNSDFLLVLIIALSASMPILLSPRQSGHYILPGMPYYAVLLAMLSAPLAELLTIRRRTCVWISVSLIVLAVAIPSALRGRIKEYRDDEFKKDITFNYRGLDIPKKQVFYACPAWNISSWGLVANMNRLFSASITDDPKKSEYRIYDLTAAGCSAIPKECSLIQKEMPKKYALLKCKGN